MILKGSLWMAVEPDLVRQGFHDADILGSFLPAFSHLTAAGPGEFDFVVIKEAGVVTLRLPGRLTVTETPDGCRFEAAARHMLGGSATLLLHLGFAGLGGGCTLTYDGTLGSTGLAARLLRDREDQAQSVIDGRFGMAKARLEYRHRAVSV